MEKKRFALLITKHLLLRIGLIISQHYSTAKQRIDHITYYTFPKVCGIFERAWNSSPAWEGTLKSDDPVFMEQFNAWYSTVVAHEFPYFEEIGINYRKR